MRGRVANMAGIAGAGKRAMRILSGVQPSGKLHLGNYFGAIRQFVALQERGEAFYFIADLHALTSVRDAAALRRWRLELALDFLALGVDPARATLYCQSEVPEISELFWLLGTLTPMGLLERAHSYKDKIAQGLSPEFGLFAYPVLMAADILAVRGELVPVGKDQKQHLEIARDLAVKFNQTWCPDFDPQRGTGGVLVLPEPHILEDSAVVPGTDGRKMSKSYGNTIEIFAPDKQLKKSVMSIVTDSRTVEEPKDPESCNVYQLLKLVAPPEELEAIAQRYRRGGMGYGEAKQLLLAHLHRVFDPARERRRELEQRPDEVLDVLRTGARRARAVAAEVLAACKEACGLA
ncbi:MAG: tryptophan--tRNA ligase [Planctomycetota bacterium]|nr:MAG: tryptophan--tRNA ligase [Planctomycetota bacterium]